jgi:hypothetical protein
MPNFDIIRIFDRWVRFRSQIERIVETDGDISRFSRSELRQNMFLLRCARRKRMYNACGHGVSRWVQPPSSTSEYWLYILFLPAQRVIKIGKSEESSRRKKSSRMHQTLHKHVITCYNMLSCVLVCLSHAGWELFAFHFWLQYPREISATQSTRSHESDMISAQEKVLWNHRQVLYTATLLWGLYRVMNFWA